MQVSHKIRRKRSSLLSTTNRILSSAALLLVGILGASTVGVDSAGSAVSARSQLLPGSLAPIPLGDKLMGPAISSTSLALQVTLDPRDPAGLASMAQAVSTPGSPEYHQYLSAGEFAQLYGPTPATIAAVTTALEAQGLGVGHASGTDLSLPVTATVAQVESAFLTPIVTYRLPSGDVGYDNTKSPSVPVSVASQIQGVLGLDTLNQPEPLTTPLAPDRGIGATTPSETSPLTSQPAPNGSLCGNSIFGVQSSYGAWTADNLAWAYDFTGLYANNDFGSGSTVALVELAGAGYSASDIATFAACYGITLGTNQITEENTDGGSNTLGGGTDEAELDIETVLSLAPAANIEVYEGNQSLYNVESQIVSDDTAKIVSISWGACEADFDPSYLQSENTLLEAASLDGQTVFAASGDDGSEGCNMNGESGSPTGDSPYAQAVNPSNGTLYVAGSSMVSVISEANESPVASISTGYGPDAVIYDSATSELYVANRGSDTLTEVSTTNCNATITSGCASTTTIAGSSALDGPDAMALDGTTLYVTNEFNQTVAVFNTTSGQFVGSVSLPTTGNPDSETIAVDSDHVVYVADHNFGEVDYFNGATCNATTQSGCSTAPVTVAVVAVPDAMVLDAPANKLFISGYQGGISVLSTSSHTVVATISTSSVPGIFGADGGVGSIAMSPNGQDLLATVNTDYSSGIYDEVLATINPLSDAVIGAVSWNWGDALMGQLVSDPTLNLVWDTVQDYGSDAVLDFNLGVSDPAAQPEVTGVGGTTLSALGPAPTEKVWNDNGEYASGAGGGGISQAFAMPNFQETYGEISGSSGTPCANVSGDCREVPDVSADADPYTGYIVYDSQEGDPGWIAVGGTSAASPLWAGALADIASADAAGATGFGSLNPALYTLAASSPGTYFNDITSGNNDYNNANGTQFSARNGYDMATGLGTPNVSALAAGLEGDLLTVPGVPTIGTPTRGNASATVNWTAPTNTGGSAITGYTVTATTGATPTTDACPSSKSSTATTCIVTGLTNGDAYTFTVAAINVVGTGSFSNSSVSVTPAAVPGAPTIGAVTSGNTLVSVNWTAPSNIGGSAIAGYTVTSENVTTSTPTTDACPSSTSSTSTSCTVTGLTNGDVYTFTVAAINNIGTSLFSGSSASATPATTPGVPAIDTPTRGNASAKVNWTAPTSTGGSAITGYTVTSENVTTSTPTTNACPSSTSSTSTR